MKSYRNFITELKIRLEYHKNLNPILWENGKLLPKVREKLLEFGYTWAKFANIPENVIQDIIMLGGNANFNYTPASDIDVHLIVDRSKLKIDPAIVDDYLQDKKILWVLTHTIKIKGYSLEPYAQDSNASYPKNQGVYSLQSNEWISQPQFLNKDFVNDQNLKQKVKFYMDLIDHLIKSKSDKETIEDIKAKLYEMRRVGIQAEGEFSFENLVFKELRNHGYMDKLMTYLNKQVDKSLSM